jgi:hypothetical protein
VSDQLEVENQIFELREYFPAKKVESCTFLTFC